MSIEITKTSDRFFRKADWAAFWIALVISFAVYFYTLAPTVSLEDSGELAVAGDALGVPHPPGYPIWTILSWLFARTFSFVHYMGQPNPSWSIGLLSAVFGAVAAALTAMLICRSGSDLLKQTWHTTHKQDTLWEDIICCVAGISGSLLFAFSPIEWSQAVIVEVYTLNAFFLIIIFLLSYWWMCRPSDRLLYVTAFIFGLGLTNYQVLLLAALPLVIIIMLRDTKLFRDFAIAGAPIAGLFLLRGNILQGAIEHPLHASCFIYLTINFAVLIMAYFMLPRGKTVAITILLAELGVGFYFFMPLASDLRNPPLNWAYPRTWAGFIHAITRGQYEKIDMVDVLTVSFLHKLAFYASDLRVQFTLLAAPLGFLPFTAWSVKIGKHRINAMFAAIFLTVSAIVIAMVHKFLLPYPAIAVIYKLIFGLVMLLMMIGVSTILVSQANELIERFLKKNTFLSEKITIGFIFLGVVAVSCGAAYKLAQKIKEITEPLRQTGVTFKDGQLSEIFLSSFGILLLMILPIVIIAGIAWIMRSRFDLKFTMDPISQKWFIGTLAGFLVMSVLLIILANPKGDIQDNFIQKVKFISSHALYAIWIGYGIIFGLAFVDTLFRNNQIINSFLKYTCLAGAALLTLLPIQQNYQDLDSELILTYGGAEQNGHDYGWQFGNYQLRGAKAISEELIAEEEPLPNPEYPPEMTMDAVFYGGTDPGRFVPTYMIYGAKVRPDVYLITQNALADDTYMSVMRDLYGNSIWIPSKPDSARSFQRYVEEVEAGIRPRNAALKVENGRVQVSGALGVMEINGILAEMIFEKNKFKHDFYVEESYVIGWMYPYLSPHGLIMKINTEKINLTTRQIDDDMDFWDWYTRRLTSDIKFKRDVVACKSFSKLRSAIAGLYANRGQPYAAEQAFQQSRLLYELSPEANFRLIQEVLLRQGRFHESKEILRRLGELDSNNKKVPEFIDMIDKNEQLRNRVNELEQVRNTGTMDMNSAFELIQIYAQVGNVDAAMQMMTEIMKNESLPAQTYYQFAQMLKQFRKYELMERALELFEKNLPPNVPPQVYLQIANIYATSNLPGKMIDPLGKYLARQPEDWQARLDLATAQIHAKLINDAKMSVNEAMRIGGNNAIQLIMQNPILAPLIQDRIQRQPQNAAPIGPRQPAFDPNNLKRALDTLK